MDYKAKDELSEDYQYLPSDLKHLLGPNIVLSGNVENQVDQISKQETKAQLYDEASNCIQPPIGSNEKPGSGKLQFSQDDIDKILDSRINFFGGDEKDLVTNFENSTSRRLYQRGNKGEKKKMQPPENLFFKKNAPSGLLDSPQEECLKNTEDYYSKSSLTNNHSGTKFWSIWSFKESDYAQISNNHSKSSSPDSIGPEQSKNKKWQKSENTNNNISLKVSGIQVFSKGLLFSNNSTDVKPVAPVDTTNEQENYQISSESHFFPIKQETSEVIPSNADITIPDGTSFPISGSYDKIDFNKSPGGSLYYGSTKYMEFNNGEAGSQSRFTPKFAVVQRKDQFCQTDETKDRHPDSEMFFPWDEQDAEEMIKSAEGSANTDCRNDITTEMNVTTWLFDSGIWGCSKSLGEDKVWGVPDASQEVKMEVAKNESRPEDPSDLMDEDLMDHLTASLKIWFEKHSQIIVPSASAWKTSFSPALPLPASYTLMQS